MAGELKSILRGIKNVGPGLDLIGGSERMKKLRLYTVGITRSNTASGTASGTIQIDQGVAPYILLSMHAEDTYDNTIDSGSIDAVYPFLASIFDTDNSYSWTNQITPRVSVFGGRQFGKILPEPVPLKPLSRITFTIQDPASGNQAGTSYITLVGWQYFN